MNKKNSRNNIEVIYILIIVCLVGISINMIGNKIIKCANDKLKIECLDSEWNYINSNNERKIIKLPNTIKDIDPSEKVQIEKNISTEKYGDASLMLRSELQSIEVYINDELVKEVKKSSKQIFGKELESSWVCIPLPSNTKEINVKIIYSSKYKGYNGRLNPIFLGNTGDQIIYILAKGFLKIFAAVSLCSLGIVLITIYFGIIKYKKINSKEFLYLGLLNIVTCFWCLFDSKVLDIFISDIIPRGELKLLCMYFILIIYLKLFMEYCSYKYLKVLKLLVKLTLLFIVINSIIHAFNICHYIESIFVFHGLCSMTFMTCIIICVKDKYFKNTINIERRIHAIVLVLIAGADMVIYYKNGFYIESRIFEYAVMISTLIFLYYMIRRSNILFRELELNSEYHYRDSLTGVLNRIAFDEKIDEIDNNLKKYLGTPIFVFNLNNLKRMNETLGHYYGNEYIKNNAEILKDIFDEYGNLYRVGADEFVFIGDKNTPIDQCEEMLCYYVERAMPEEKILLTGISYGYDIISKDNKNIYEVHARAEINMNKLKKRLKRSNIR